MKMDIEASANKLRHYIREGNARRIQEMLNSVTDPSVIREIDEKFVELNPGTDPVNLAINCSQEKIACFLVEKAFATDRVYSRSGQTCDEWCYYEHGSDPCKADYDALDHAESQNLYKLKNLIEQIRLGLRFPGDGLPNTYIQQHMPKAPPEETRPKYDRPVHVAEIKKKTDADEAKELLEKKGRNYVSKHGDTLFHECIYKPTAYTYVFASNGVPINIQNKDWDTALHLAVRYEIVDQVEALVQCGADIIIRNKMGQSPLSESSGAIKTLLTTFQPGLLGACYHGDKHTLEKFRKLWCHTDTISTKPGVVAAVSSGKSQALDRILKSSWASLSSRVKDDKTILQLAIQKSEEDKRVLNCVRLLKDFRTTSRLIHAVLCEDIETAKSIMENEKGWNTNLRFGNRNGKTLLSHSIDANNLELVKLLVDKGGAKVNHVRVGESGTSDVTMPLFHRCLKPGLNPDIAKFLNSRMNASERSEKDKNGNTAILRAIEEECSPKLIFWLIDSSGGNCLIDRNKDGLTPKEFAIARKNTAVVKAIDRYIIQKPANVARYSTHFCHSEDILDITDEVSGKTLPEVIQEQCLNGAEKWLSFPSVEKEGIRLFEAAAKGKVKDVDKLYNANYQDRNGYTALIRAIAYQQYDVCSYLCNTRPILKAVPDNCNRFPLHYAYALPDKVHMDFVRLLMEKNPENIESRVDKDGKYAAEYKDLRETSEIQTILYDARTLDAFGNRQPPMSPWPEGARRSPPDRHVIGQATVEFD